MKLFKYESYKITISEEALLLKPFKKIWDRDKSKSKEKALSELGFIYFFCDARSDYQYIVDEELRKEQIKEGEGMSKDWQPDKLVEEAMEFYNKDDSMKYSMINHNCQHVAQYIISTYGKVDKDDKLMSNFKGLELLSQSITDALRGPKIMF